MIVETKRANGFGAVLKGGQLKVNHRAGEHYVLTSWGNKRETGELYEFRVMLTVNEVRSIVQAYSKLDEGVAPNV